MNVASMTTPIDIVLTETVNDSDGFGVQTDITLASVRAYKEPRHASSRWANLAAFSTANVLFRFRVIPGVMIEPGMQITDADGRYRISSAQNIRDMYIEAYADDVKEAVR